MIINEAFFNRVNRRHNSTIQKWYTRLQNIPSNEKANKQTNKQNI